MKNISLQDKHHIRELSYKPSMVKNTKKPIIDIVTGGRYHPTIMKWRNYFKLKDVPVFACGNGKDTQGHSSVKLWIERTVGQDGELI